MDSGYAITKEIWESDVSIIGFDDIPLSSKVTPALTTMRQSFIEFGKIAADSIMKMMNGDMDYRKYILAVELIERNTV